MKWAIAACVPLFLALASLAACDGVEVRPAIPDDTPSDFLPDSSFDAGATLDAADSGCPAPAKLTPAQIPTGYKPAEKVTLVRPTDGDTAHYKFASGEQTCRFLYVNTEESFGDRTTDFGILTKSAVAQYLTSAQETIVAPREREGGVDLDPFGRTLALVYIDGELFETRLIREGLSAYYTQYGCAPEPLHSAFIHAEAEARANKRGIWKDGHPTDYREVLREWIGNDKCRPNPYEGPYCK